ncbi:MAG: GNAT family N-acetyltransferase [Burkholderiales bacterium]|nr:GNAT family N-acetyltransferase [Anaerolineae bacterium]
MQPYTMRPLSAADEPFLWEIMYHAIHVAEGEAPPRDIVRRPELAHYLDGWGREHDGGFIAEVDGQPVGAVWLRLLQGDDQGYGYVDDATPELSIALLAEHRGRGVGTRLLEAGLDDASKRYAAVSLSVDPSNAAMRLYERFGFVVVGESSTSLTMKKVF